MSDRPKVKQEPSPLEDEFCSDYFSTVSKLLNSITHLLEHEKGNKKEKNSIRMSSTWM